ncbi:MAG: hypothetical protein RIR37_183 [Verrucomicrobiota bacterium]
MAPADLGIHDLFTFASIGVHSRFSIFLQRVGAAGRIALPEMKEVSRKMRDKAGGTPARPFEETASSIHNPRSTITSPLCPLATLVSWR